MQHENVTNTSTATINESNKDKNSAIDREIENFLKSTRPLMLRKEVFGETQNSTKLGTNTLIEQLTRLEKLYTQIKSNLEYNRTDDLKENLLSDRINSTLICENLIKVLKETLNERNDALTSEDKIKKEIDNIKKRTSELEILNNKKENEINYVRNSNNELARLLQDNKNKMTEYKQKNSEEKNKLEEIKIINEELESLRKKCNVKIQILEAEIQTLKETLKSKNKMLDDFKIKQTELDKKEENLNKKFIDMENVVDVYKKKIEQKSKSLEMINEEMARLLSKNRSSGNESGNYKEKSDYFENLYKSTLKQNENLTEELQKFLQAGKGKVPIIEENNEETNKINKEFEFKELKYKRRLNKYKELNQESKRELEKLQNNKRELEKELETIKNMNIRNIQENKEITNNLMGKIENMMKQNTEYRAKVDEIQNMPSKIKIAENISNFEKNFLDEEFYEPNSKILDDNYSNLNMFSEINEKLNKFNLKDKGSKDQYIESIIKRNEMEKNEKNLKKEINFDFLNNSIEEKKDDKEFEIIKSMTEKILPEVKPKRTYKKRSNRQIENKKTEKIIKDEIIKPETYSFMSISEEKLEDLNSVSTTESVRKMKSKTMNLKKKFDDLNEKLQKIKSSERSDEDKLSEQVNVLSNYHYSNAMELGEEDSDFL